MSFRDMYISLATRSNTKKTILETREIVEAIDILRILIPKTKLFKKVIGKTDIYIGSANTWCMLRNKKSRFVVLLSFVIRHISDDLLISILDHEACHIICEHCRLQNTGDIVKIMSEEMEAISYHHTHARSTFWGTTYDHIIEELGYGFNRTEYYNKLQEYYSTRPSVLEQKKLTNNKSIAACCSKRNFDDISIDDTLDYTLLKEDNPCTNQK